MLKKSIIPALFALFALVSVAPAQDYLILTGKLLDKKTKQPVPYAHIGIPEKGIGTTSGFDGGFEFKVPSEFAASTLTATCMGYEPFGQSVQAFKNGSVIYLQAAVNQLREVVVMDKRAIEEIIRKAVKKIPDNYPDRPTNQLAFYRESLTDDSLRYKYLAEGVLKIYRTSYENKKEGQVGLVQGRKINLQDPLDTAVYSGFLSGHMAAHRFDFVKNREDFIDERYFPVYNYWIENITTYNGRPVYIIGFDKDPAGKPSNTKKKKRSLADKLTGKNRSSENTSARMKGRIFIEQESYAFLRAEFEITKEGLEKSDDYPLYSGYWNANKYVVNYRKQDGKWYFGDAFREGVRPKGGIYSNEVKTTEISTERGEQIPYMDRLEKGNEFVEMTGRYDEGFWKNYNTTPLSEGLAEGVQHYKNMLKAQEAFSEANLAAIQQKRDSVEAARIQQEKEEMAQNQEITQEQLENVDYVPPKLQQVDTARKRFKRTTFMLGLGSHLVQSASVPMFIQYNNGDGDPILALDGRLPNRDFEVLGHWGFDIFYHKNLFIRINRTFDFYNSIYREWALGQGLQVKLSGERRRPVFLKTSAQYSFLKYFRKVGNAENDYGKFRVDGERFRGDAVRLSYGSRMHNLKLSAELSIETKRHTELFFRANYHYTFASKAGIWFKETKQFSRRDAWLPLDDSRLTVLSNDAAYDQSMLPGETWSFSVGFLFK